MYEFFSCVEFNSVVLERSCTEELNSKVDYQYYLCTAKLIMTITKKYFYLSLSPSFPHHAIVLHPKQQHGSIIIYPYHGSPLKSFFFPFFHFPNRLFLSTTYSLIIFTKSFFVISGQFLSIKNNSE